MRLLVAVVVLALATTAPRSPAQEGRTGKPEEKASQGLADAGRRSDESGDPELMFTFDDGPNPKTTPPVLDALAKHHIHAMFFMVGEMAQNRRPRR